MKLSYSEYRDYLICPQKYKYIVDKTPKPAKENRYFALYGSLMEKFFERYTNYYTKNNIILTNGQLKEVLNKEWENILSKNYVSWTEPYVQESKEQLFEKAYTDILKNIGAFDFWKESRAEVSVDIFLKKSKDILTCRLDFLWSKNDGKIEIIDGKGTAKMDTNVDVDQLLFYALIYLLKHGKLPDKLGFLYYQYQLIKYMDFDMPRILAFRDKLVETKNNIKADKTYAAKVMFSKQCKWCVYKYICKGYKEKREAKDNSKMKIDVLEDTTEVTNLGLGALS